MRTVGFLAAIAFAAAAWSFELNCACDPTNPETLNVRQCSLCREAEKQPPDQSVFFLKDNNPRKANRTLDRRDRKGPKPLGRRVGHRLQRSECPDPMPRPRSYWQIPSCRRDWW